jgi:hypothetical protein
LIGSINKFRKGEIIGQGTMLTENILILIVGTVEIRVPIEDIQVGVQDVKAVTFSSEMSVYDYRHFHYTILKKYTAGSIFEEHKSAMAVATDNTVLLKLDLVDYQRIVKYVHDLKNKQVIYYLNQIDLCNQMDMESKTLLSNVFLFLTRFVKLKNTAKMITLISRIKRLIRSE